ncbi:MAG: gamma-glutamylcyclotransferase [Oscillospiraceae bacterium]|nr:gamma-glutamylcyclotransferase [Oscillospiraceae bacterium]
MINELKNLRNGIETGKWNRREETLWGGAGVQLCLEPVEPTTDGWYPDPRFVVTPNAEIYSALMYDLRDICTDAVNYVSKYEFYGSLCDVIEESESAGASVRETLLSMTDTATRFVKHATYKVYIAYGSNMDEAQMAHRCPDALLCGKTVLRDKRFALDSAGVATLIPEEGAAAEVLLWEISPEDEKTLDRYEGVEQGCYRREYMTVEHDGYVCEKALVYISNRPLSKTARRSGYMERITAAARAHGFAPEYIAELESHL